MTSMQGCCASKYTGYIYPNIRNLRISLWCELLRGCLGKRLINRMFVIDIFLLYFEIANFGVFFYSIPNDYVYNGMFIFRLWYLSKRNITSPIPGKVLMQPAFQRLLEYMNHNTIVNKTKNYDLQHSTFI